MATKTTSVDFYTAGLNATNWAYDYDALTGILNSSAIVGGRFTLSAPLAFGVSFYISLAEYELVKNATYIQIINLYNDSTLETRFAFINEFVEMNNGKWRVDYTIDDWASYIISGYYPNMNIEGFTERANLKLTKSGKYDFEYLVGDKRQKHNDIIKDVRFGAYTQQDGGYTPYFLGSLSSDYFCVLYFLKETQFDGEKTGEIFRGTLADIDVKNGRIPRYIDRENSNIVYMIYKRETGGNVALYAQRDYDPQKASQGLFPGTPYVEYLAEDSFRYTDVADATIEKAIYLDYFPSVSGDVEIVAYNYAGTGLLTFFDKYGIEERDEKITINVPMLSDDRESVKKNLSDIAFFNDKYFKAPRITTFAPMVQFRLSNVDNQRVLKQVGVNITGQDVTFENTYQNYLINSRYFNSEEISTIKLKYCGAEFEIPRRFLTTETTFYFGLSGDAETVYIKATGLSGQANSNEITCTAQNQAFFDYIFTKDMQAYKTAKISGATSVVSSAVGAVASVASVASGNVGAVGGLVSSIGSIAGSLEKMKGLSPIRQTSAVNDFTLVQVLDDNKLVIELTTTAEPLRTAEVVALERNGVKVSIEFNEYLRTQRCQAYNAIRLQSVDIHGVPQAIADRVASALLGGITLWTATNVGDKDVINYEYVEV